ncbi:MAG: ATP12 family protein [Caulobacteraceae bacterium]
MAQPPQSLRPARRFYDKARAVASEGGFTVSLDGRAIRSPRGRPFELPTRALAGLVVGEWNAQGASVDLTTMPATRLAHTAIDGVAEARDDAVGALVDHAATDLLCYLAEGPASLVERQERTWGPLLDWGRNALGLDFVRARGIVHTRQPPKTIAAVRELAEKCDDFDLAGLAYGAALTGSAVIALALRAGRIAAADAFAAARVDEAFQEDRWGIDAETAVRTAGLAAETAMLGAWFGALRGRELVTKARPR